ncbi:MAG: hypothetical protein NT049_06645 [Planctomycetota bacterium]|nr:hypothetical protein [Planctomycetota bacterium]
MRKLCLTAAALVAALGLGASAGLAAEQPGGFSPDNDGFICNWLLTDPIEVGDRAGTHEEDSQKEFFTKEFFPGQNTAMPKLGDKVKIGQTEMAWKTGGDFALNLGKIAEDAGKPFEKAIVLGVCYVWADADMTDVKLKIGSDDSSCWSLNGKDVIRVYSGRACEKDQDTKDGLALKKGCNVLAFRVINGDGEFGACARFTDKNDKPLALKVALQPGATPKDVLPVDAEGFINNWLILDPIELGDKAGSHDEESQKEFFDKAFVPAGATPEAGAKVKVGDKEMAWKAVSNAAQEWMINLKAMADRAGKGADNSVVLGLCYLWADADMNDLKLKIGSDDSSCWRLNDKEVIRVFAGRACEKDTDTKDGLALKKGLNVLRVIVINGGGEFGFCARLTDKDDKPVKNVKILLAPPEK